MDGFDGNAVADEGEDTSTAGTDIVGKNLPSL
jgi:hypothetical protein